jgi:dipeptidyl-peptidase-4
VAGKLQTSRESGYPFLPPACLPFTYTPSEPNPVTQVTRRLRLLVCLAAAVPAGAAAQQNDSTLLSVQRIFGSADFRPDFFGPARWLDDGAAYTTLEKAPSGKGQDLVRYDSEKGTREVMVPAAQLVPAGDSTPLTVEDYSWSPDGKQLLVFTNSKPVWRQNNRGDYWILDRARGKLRKLGGPDAAPSSLLFAKFSPDGGRVGYVREHNIYVEDLATGAITQLTRDGSRDIINGTFDWVYEEELDDRDGWRWSPDGKQIAYWQLNADSVRNFTLIDDTDSLYSFTIPVQYPKAGQQNSAARVGVVSAAGGDTRWFDIPGDPRQHYLARMDWAANSSELLLQRLNRLQNTDEVLLGDAATGKVRPIITERDSAWVDVVPQVTWLDKGRSFTWLSERDGWRHLYVVSRDGRTTKLITPGNYDVIDLTAVDDKGGFAYFIASPDNPAQRYLYRARLDGKGKAERLSPAAQSGSHLYDISPNARFAIHTFHNFTQPPVTELVRLPSHAVVRTLQANDRLRQRVAALKRGPVEWTRLDVDGHQLPAFIMKPADFDSTRKYPVLFFVYGGPATQTVLDGWGGSQALWFTMLTQKGYIVASVDNRGTPAPLGRAWRKAIYGRMGVLETQEQTDAAKLIARRPYVDANRIGIWGWSNGGFMTLNCLFRSPDVYRMGIAVAPVTNWRFYDNIYTERYNGLPQDNAKGYEEGSPVTYAAGLKGDLLLVHGSGDDNVHYQNSETLINALIAADKQFQMMEYPNRNHGIFGGNTRQHLFGLLTKYLDDHLLTARTVMP